MDYKMALLNAEEKGVQNAAKQIMRRLRSKHVDEKLIINTVQEALGNQLSTEDINSILKDK